jgi:hypothetical protein
LLPHPICTPWKQTALEKKGRILLQAHTFLNSPSQPPVRIRRHAPIAREGQVVKSPEQRKAAEGTVSLTALGPRSRMTTTQQQVKTRSTDI